ncbi:MAG: nucleotide exchange factor GrpE, partial [Candidatus Moraniibacteriota bacterium]
IEVSEKLENEDVFENKEQEYLEGWKRCLSDFENYKKRQQENQKNIGAYIKEDLILQVLPVIDNFRSATEHIPEEQKEAAWVVGIMYIQKQLENILKENEVVEMDVKMGDEFDPNLHEAIADNQKAEDSKKEEDEKEPGNKIKKVVLKGYKLNNRVIRAARVIVG